MWIRQFPLLWRVAGELAEIKNKQVSKFLGPPRKTIPLEVEAPRMPTKAIALTVTPPEMPTRIIPLSIKL